MEGCWLEIPLARGVKGHADRGFARGARSDTDGGVRRARQRTFVEHRKKGVRLSALERKQQDCVAEAVLARLGFLGNYPDENTDDG